ncbi:hypothetical protein [Amycolatopsis sp. PS_44_ISF1]|uniref:hypothetical protein n=1 Tax=Amycolatopsis sp. PS_44_ISF1 TaxID=2974917 RepID=UPI0028DE6447|nr:hypothetical protein [Amycolatopsis sp. PS_44_ISF1]MDT8915722.1 hypothetical protein [Amycolatopsis sp. PS_44_ISF1]
MADTVVTGDEATGMRELRRYWQAGVTDLAVAPIGSRAERKRTVGLVARLER